jgi:FkbH-like protein
MPSTEITELLWSPKERASLVAGITGFEADAKDNEVIAECKIAILSGSTTNWVARFLKLFLLNKGIKAETFEGHFGNFFIDAMNPSAELIAFEPDIIYLHTSRVNLKNFSKVRDFENNDECNFLISEEVSQAITIWESLNNRFNCWVIQNNLDLSPDLPLGNSEGTELIGHNFAIREINQYLATESRKFSQVVVHDINALSASVGLEEWWSSRDWIQYGLAISMLSQPRLAFSLACVVTSILGESKKCLVLDFDNTLWGGVVGEVGVAGIELGPDSSRGKAFLDFQLTIKDLVSRGVLIAGCTKNEKQIALSGLSHPNSILKLEDFAVIEASWDPKPVAMRRIIDALNIGSRSMVFVDDSSIEVHAVKAEFPEIESVILDSKFPEKYSSSVLRPRFFESLKLTKEDTLRNGTQANLAGKKPLSVSTYDHIKMLSDLNSVVAISKPSNDQLERVTQLVNKTNQFNLNGQRRTPTEIKRLARESDSCLLIGELRDDLTNYGVVTAIGGQFVGNSFRVDVWVMSCRTFDRYLEHAMISALRSEIVARSIDLVSLEIKRTARNDYFINTCSELGLFEKSVGDGSCLVQASSIKSVVESPLKVVLK